MAVGWRQEPAPADPAASRWTRDPAATHDVVLSVLPTGPVLDEYPLPSVDPPHPRLERVLAVVAPWWVARRAAARVARYQRAVWKRITPAQDARHRASDLPSRAGPSWRGSPFWHR
jgi:hypothetical protein